jgi:DNA-binding IclR family transcriptional regulator
VPFRRPGRPLQNESGAGAVAVTLFVSDGDVVLALDGYEVELSAEQARELSRELAEVASDAEADRG